MIRVNPCILLTITLLVPGHRNPDALKNDFNCAGRSKRRFKICNCVWRNWNIYIVCDNSQNALCWEIWSSNSVTGWFEWCEADNSKCSSQFVCVAKRCRCTVLNYYDHAKKKCIAQETYDAKCTNYLGCRVDQGLNCHINLKKCLCESGTWSNETQVCEGRTKECSTDLTDHLWDCWMYVEDLLADVNDLAYLSHLMQLVDGLCEQQVENAIQCIKGILTQCPKYEQTISSALMFSNYTMIHNWTATHCQDPDIKEFTGKQGCVLAQVESDTMKTCMANITALNVSQSSGLYPCGTKDQVKKCIDETIGTNCGQTVADVASTFVQIIQFGEEANCTTAGEDKTTPRIINILSYLSQIIYRLTHFKLF